MTTLSSPGTDPGTRLAAAGRPLTLNDGRTVHLRYSMRSLLHLERQVGGLAALQGVLNSDGTGAMIEPGLQLLTAGLLHEHDGTGAPLTVDRVAELLDTHDFPMAMHAAGAAMAEAFPPPPAPQDGATPTSPPLQVAQPTADVFRGPTGTTPAPSSSAAATASSGR